MVDKREIAKGNVTEASFGLSTYLSPFTILLSIYPTKKSQLPFQSFAPARQLPLLYCRKQTTPARLREPSNVASPAARSDGRHERQCPPDRGWFRCHVDECHRSRMRAH